jgi:uridine kinase
VKKITDEINKKLINRTYPLLVSIDGGSSAGKSTIAILVAKEVNAVIIQGDDFCQTGINWDQFSEAEKAEKCIDWPRARKEAIEPLLAGKTASWHPFNFQTGIGLADYEVIRKPAPVIIIDGLYSSNPYLADILDLTILIDTPAQVRYLRHNEREGHEDTEWHNLWDKVELYYLTKVRPPSSFDLVITI